MDGFKRPGQKRPTQMNLVAPPPQVEDLASKLAEPKITRDEVVSSLPQEQPKEPIAIAKKRRLWAIFVGIGLLVIALALTLAYLWYQSQLSPANPDDTAEQKVVINSGTSYNYVATRLKERGLIKDELAFNIYGFISGKRNQLKEGTCSLKSSESVQQIVDKLTSGCHDFKAITFYPGATIERPLYKPDHAELDQNINIKGVLASAGYSEAAIEAALAKQYEGPLFDGKPAGASLEGYIYGETYYIDPDASVETVLQTAFNQMYKDVSPLIGDFKKHNLNLFQAITLSSIVQRELNCEGKEPAERKQRCHEYQRQIAQVFLKRLDEGISLGADVTFIYAADQMGVTPTIDLDSPYNTRIHTGLTPGPIGSPGLSALKAVANPADTDYLFFVAGDDGLIYFAKTQAEHEQNIRNHCQQRCEL